MIECIPLSYFCLRRISIFLWGSKKCWLNKSRYSLWLVRKSRVTCRPGSNSKAAIITHSSSLKESLNMWIPTRQVAAMLHTFQVYMCQKRKKSRPLEECIEQLFVSTTVHRTVRAFSLFVSIDQVFAFITVNRIVGAFS